MAELARLGGKLVDLCWTGGNVRTTTMRAFGRDEVEEIIAKAKGQIDARRDKPSTGRGSAHGLRLGRQALPSQLGRRR